MIRTLDLLKNSNFDTKVPGKNRRRLLAMMTLPYMQASLIYCVMRCENCGELLLESRSEILDKMQNGISPNAAVTCSNCGQASNKNVVIQKL